MSRASVPHLCVLEVHLPIDGSTFRRLLLETKARPDSQRWRAGYRPRVVPPPGRANKG